VLLFKSKSYFILCMTEIQQNQLENIIKHSSKQDPFKYIKKNKQNTVKNSNISEKLISSTSKIYRQGDILFKKIERLPNNLNEKTDKVVAEGEETGHAHILLDGALFELINSESLFIKSDQTTRIIHDEHLPIKLESGNYQVIRQREYLGPGVETRIVSD